MGVFQAMEPDMVFGKLKRKVLFEERLL